MEKNAAYRLKAKDHDHVHSPEEHIIAEAVTEEVTMETNTAYWFSTENQLQILVKQVTMESITKCEVNTSYKKIQPNKLLIQLTISTVTHNLHACITSV